MTVSELIVLLQGYPVKEAKVLLYIGEIEDSGAATDIDTVPGYCKGDAAHEALPGGTPFMYIKGWY